MDFAERIEGVLKGIISEEVAKALNERLTALVDVTVANQVNTAMGLHAKALSDSLQITTDRVQSAESRLDSLIADVKGTQKTVVANLTTLFDSADGLERRIEMVYGYMLEAVKNSDTQRDELKARTEQLHDMVESTQTRISRLADNLNGTDSNMATLFERTLHLDDAREVMADRLQSLEGRVGQHLEAHESLWEKSLTSPEFLNAVEQAIDGNDMLNDKIKSEVDSQVDAAYDGQDFTDAVEGVMEDKLERSLRYGTLLERAVRGVIKNELSFNITVS